MLRNETRKLVLEAYDKHHNVKEVAKSFSVDTSTVYRLLEQRRRTGSVETRTYLRGRKSSLDEENLKRIRKLVEEQPDITLQRIIDTLELQVCIETVRKALLKMGYSYKKVLLNVGGQERMVPCYVWVRKEVRKSNLVQI